MELVTIIVPIYNAEKYLNKCLESLHNQTYSELEIILINDGSRDQSEAICKKYCDIDSRMKVITKANGGVSSARNEGLRLAQGDYVVFVDADDMIHEQFVELLIGAVKESSYGIAVCGIKNISEKTVIGRDIALEYLPKDIPIEKYDSREKYAKRSVWGAVFQKELLKNVFFDNALALGEDSLFFATALKRSGGVCFLPNEMYYYLRHRDSSSYVADVKRQDTEFIAWNEMFKLFSTESSFFIRQLHLAYAFACLNSFFRRCLFIGKFGDESRSVWKRMKKEIKYMRYEKNKKDKYIYILCCLAPRFMGYFYRKKKDWEKGFVQ